MNQHAKTLARIPPLESPYAPEVAAELSRWMPRRAQVDPPKLFRTLVKHLPLAQAMLPMGKYLLSRGLSVGLREREVVIDRVCARCACEYEWGVHATMFGPPAGLGDDQLRASAIGTADDPAWTATDALLIRLVDELHDRGHVSDDLWGSLVQLWSPEQLLDLLVLAGWYHVIAFVANGARVECEEWALRFPSPTVMGSESGPAAEGGVTKLSCGPA